MKTKRNIWQKLVAALAFSLTVFSGAAVLAQTHTLIRAGALLNVEDGSILENPSVLITDQLIVAINPLEVPDNTTIIDLGKEMMLLPGLMDAHVHLGITEPKFEDSWYKENAATGVLRAAANARNTLMSGFTTVRDLGQVNTSLDLIIVALANGISSGLVSGPDIIAAGQLIGISGGHFDPSQGSAEGRFELGWRYGVADGPEEMVKAVRYQIKNGATVIKIGATAGLVSLERSAGGQQMTDAEMQAVVDEASRHDIKVAAHAHGTEGIKAAVRAGVASIEHGSLLDKEIMSMMKEKGTYLVPTTGLYDFMEFSSMVPLVQRKAEYMLPLAESNLRKAIDGGLLIALGTDAPMLAHGKNAYEFEALVKKGMSPLQAIQAGTINTADLFGTPDRGQIKVGLRADIVAVSGNPLEDITVLQKVEFVMKAGVVYKNTLK